MRDNLDPNAEDVVDGGASGLYITGDMSIERVNTGKQGRFDTELYSCLDRSFPLLRRLFTN